MPRSSTALWLLAFHACVLMPGAVHADFQYEYYEGAWTTLPNFDALVPVATGSAARVSTAPRLRDNRFGLRFRGQIDVPAADDYRFRLTSDDGAVLRVDGSVVIDNDGLHASRALTGTRRLAVGRHTVEVTFFERDGREVLSLEMARGGAAFAPVDAAPAAAANSRATRGEWGRVIAWPEIAISAAALPDGRVLTWSSTELDRFPSNREFTHASLFDPVNETFESADSNFHDMFCAGITMQEDGSVLAAGGNPQDQRTSAFSPIDMTWRARADMNFNRWYGTTVQLPDNSTWATFAKAAGDAAERYSPVDDTWVTTPGATMTTLRVEQNAANSRTTVNSASDMQWWSKMAVMPDGRVFHGGPTPTMHVFDASGDGSTQTLGQPLGQRARMWSNAVAYDVGKLLLVGGSDRSRNPATTSANAFDVDLTGTSPVVSSVAPMIHARALSNSVVLPTGEVLVIGGNATGELFDDAESVLAAELWNPGTDTWTELAAMSVPRNYHSVALLLRDGRVLSAGGGACGNCSANHQDGQLYSPPYLFAADGSAAPRPAITSAPSQVFPGGALSVQTSGAVQRFSMVRLSGTTHATNTDQRYVPVTSQAHANGAFTLTLNANPNVLIPGYYWLFAIDASGVPSEGFTLQVRTAGDAPPPDLGIFDVAGDIGGVAAPGSSAHVNGAYTLRGSGYDIEDFFDEFHFLRRSQAGDVDVVARVVSLTQPHEWAKAGVMLRASAASNAARAMVIARPDGQVTMQWRTAAGADAGWTGVLAGGTGLPKYVRLTRRGNTFEGAYSKSSASGPWTVLGRIDVPMPTTALAGLALTSHNDGQIATAEFDNVSVDAPQPPDATDSDGDGVPDASDAFPDDPNESSDRDGDGVGDNADAFPDDATEQADSDADGVGDNADLYPLDANNGAFQPRASSTLVRIDDGRSETFWNVNPDNGTVSAVDANGTKIGEVNVGGAPWAVAAAPLADELWVSNKDTDQLHVIDTVTRAVTRSVALPRAARAHGLVFVPDSDVLLVVLEARGELLSIDAASGSVTGTLDVGANARHVGVSGDGARAFVTRFVTPPLAGEPTLNVDVASGGGEVLAVNLASFSVTRTVRLAHSGRAPSESAGPGVPNYLGAPVVSADGGRVYIPSKQDNVRAGGARGGAPGMLSFDQGVRAVTSVIEIGGGVPATDALSSRMDHDNASVATGAVATADGRYLFIALESSREVAIIATGSGGEIGRISVGRAPQGLALSARGRRLYVHNFMDRSVAVFDIGSLVDTGTPQIESITTTGVVGAERLGANVLRGKQLFYDAADTRLAADRYMSCASCHNDGGSDGRVWDLTQAGEGVRSTPSLRGRGIGRAHWSGNFDEVQDFEQQIRSLSGGSGLMSDTDFQATRDPLGAPKAGRSADLDALAAYVNSLDEPLRSPHRGADLSVAAAEGRALADTLGCVDCHSGAALSDSASGARHDIGTLTAASGGRNGGTLDGLDTPSLLGAWQGAPYLHDGSAASLSEAVLAHAGVSVSASELSSLVAWLRELERGDAPGTGAVCDGCIDFRGTPTESFSDQDVAGNVQVIDNGAGLRLVDNTWRRTTRTFDVTPNTVVEFEFESSAEGEMHGIGFDADNQHDSFHLFRLHGRQDWGRDDFENYPGSGRVVYRIPVGRYYTGTGMYLFFVNDDDVSNGHDSVFRNVRVYEDDAGCSDCVDFSSVPTGSYSDQDRAGNVQVGDGGLSLSLRANTWRRSSTRYRVTARTVIEFDFESTVEGEIHGIGFDENNQHSSSRLFKLHGTQAWGIRTFDNYSGGRKRYRIPVGQYYIGDSMGLIFVNDKDAGDTSRHDSRFSNLRIFEE